MVSPYFVDPDHPHRFIPDYEVGLRRQPLVAGIGFGHTGTTSLAAALRGLDLRTKHWTPETRTLLLLRLSNGLPIGDSALSSTAVDFMSVAGDSSDESWMARVHQASENFEWGWQLLNETDAILDEPVNLLWRHIYDRFPDTKFILTLRNATEWADSEYKWYGLTKDGRMNATLPKDWMYWNWCNKAFNTSCASKYFEYCFGTSQPTKSDLIRAYEKHVRDVKATIPKDQLLEFQISDGDGYKKLTDFLGLPMPRDWHGRLRPFPSVCNGECVHGDVPARAVEHE